MSKKRDLAYAEGYFQGVLDSSWQCHDCGNTYGPDVDECPNMVTDEAKAKLRHAQWKVDNEGRYRLLLRPSFYSDAGRGWNEPRGSGEATDCSSGASWLRGSHSS